MHTTSVRAGLPIRTTQLNVDVSNLTKQLHAQNLGQYVSQRKPHQKGVVLYEVPGVLKNYAWIIQHEDGVRAAYYYDELDREN